jgi:hypothetical protein
MAIAAAAAMLVRLTSKERAIGTGDWNRQLEPGTWRHSICHLTVTRITKGQREEAYDASRHGIAIQLCGYRE